VVVGIEGQKFLPTWNPARLPITQAPTIGGWPPRLRYIRSLRIGGNLTLPRALSVASRLARKLLAG